MKIHVANLSPETDGPRLREAFAVYGEVASASVVTDRTTQRSREFGFVEMPQTSEAEAAIRGLAGSTLNGRIMTVDEARPKAFGANPPGSSAPTARA